MEVFDECLLLCKILYLDDPRRRVIINRLSQRPVPRDVWTLAIILGKVLEERTESARIILRFLYESQAISNYIKMYTR